MPDQPREDPSIVTKRESVEVITPDGQSLNGAKNLNSIFDKIESGQSVGDAIKETMDSRPSPDAKPLGEEVPPPAKKEETPPAPEPENKPEAKSLDEAFTKEEDKQTKAAMPKVDDAEVPDEELVVLHTDKPKTAKRIQALLGKITKADSVVAETKKEIEAKAAELKKLQDQLATVQPVDPKTQEEVKQQLEELKQYRRRYELEKDPEVQARFDAKIQGADDSIYGVLKGRGALDPLIKTIKDEGGWARFSDSKKLITIKGEEEPITHEELAKRITDTLSYSERTEITRAVTEALQAKKDKDRYFEEEGKKANEYFSQREQEQKQQYETQRQTHENAIKKVDGFYEELIKNNEWLRTKEVPSNASPAQKAAIEEDNQWAKQTVAEVKKMKEARNLDEILAVVDQAARYHYERRQAGRLAAENKALKAEMEKIRNASKTTGRAGSLAAGAPPETVNRTKKPATLEDAFAAIESGDMERNES